MKWFILWLNYMIYTHFWYVIHKYIYIYFTTTYVLIFGIIMMLCSSKWCFLGDVYSMCIHLWPFYRPKCLQFTLQFFHCSLKALQVRYQGFAVCLCGNKSWLVDFLLDCPRINHLTHTCTEGDGQLHIQHVCSEIQMRTQSSICHTKRH